jgi:hypothetical protein
VAKPIAPEIKGAALAEIATGEPIATTAKKYGVARSTVNKWVEESRLSEPVATQAQRDQLGDAIHGWMVKCVETLTAQLDVAMDGAWLREHSPSDLAALISVLAEKLARVAETQQVGLAEDSAPTPIRRVS